MLAQTRGSHEAFPTPFLAAVSAGTETGGDLARRLLAASFAGFLTLAAPAEGRAEPEVRILLRQKSSTIRVTADSGRIVADGQGIDARPARVALDLRSGRGRIRFGRRSARRLVVSAQGPVGVDGRKYLGRIEVVAEDGGLTVVNRLPVETYLLGIVGSEMPAEWPLEALKAQAVAARTYALQRRLRRRATSSPWDLRDSVLSQVYRGAESIRPSVIRAVRETRGWVLAFHHEPAEALFHSTCGGHTVTAAEVFGQPVQYLVRRPCDWCRESGRYRWELKLDRREVARLLRQAGLSRDFERLERKGSEGSLWIEDGRGARRVPPEKLRAALGFGRLYSTRFDVHQRGRRVELLGAGFGHRVGMCQWGARGQAAEGRSHRDILRYYYPGALLKRAY